MHFFATPADLHDWFGRVESKYPLGYARIDAFSYPDTPVYATVADIPDLLKEDAAFFLTPPGTQPGRYQPELRRGGPWFYVDGHCEENRAWPVLRPSSLVDGVFEEGWVSLEDKVDHKRLKRVIESERRAAFQRRGAVWIGPEAVAWLMAGKVRFAEKEDGEQRKVPKTYHPCKLGTLVAGVPFDPAWRTPDVLRLARQWQDASDADTVAVLADALEDAGCSVEVFLGHCRWAGKHHASCWLPAKVRG